MRGRAERWRAWRERRRQARRCKPKRGRWPRRVFWRVYIYGVLMLIAVMVSLGTFGWLLSVRRSVSPAERAARYLRDRVSVALQRPAVLQNELELLHQVFDADVNVYRYDGERLAHAGESLPSPGNEDEIERQLDGRRYRLRHGTLLLQLEGGHVLLAHSRWLRRSHRFSNLLGSLVVLLVLALVSLPLARGIVRPIERVTEAARRLGEGDLSARTGIERRDEIGTLAKTVDHMAERLEITVKNERELLANVSHELRTPLARIRVAMELVDDDTVTADEQREHLGAIREDVAELEQLIDQILAAARLDAASNGGLPLRRVALAPGELIERVRSRFEATHPEHHLEVSVADELPELHADVTLLSRLLNNVLDNAAKYAGAEAGPVELSALVRDGNVELTVRDHGEGVAPSDLQMLFEPFFRADRSRQRQRGGVGLGLSLCRRIARAHGGSIAAELPEGGGLLVRVQLPV